MLPEDLDMAFWQELKTFEEEQQMAYVTSAERFGRQIGREQGLEEGQVKKATEVALKMMSKGMDLATIAELTDLPISQVEGLASAQIQQLQTELNRN
jgi:predicted transposase/invertase (TIGR01784 family)